MAILNNSNAISTGGYDINNSLRFRRSASAYLNRTPASSGSQTTWTYSTWFKRGALGSDQILITAGATNNDTNCYITSSDKIYWFNRAGGSMNGIKETAQVFRDPSAWYHIMLVWDTTQGTASNRMKIYVNGSQVTAFSSSTDPSLNTTSFWNSNVSNKIASDVTAGSNTLDGYLAEINFINAQALTPSSFGETDTTTGSWKPKAYTGTYGTNGFYLKFSDIATTSGSNAGLGKDFSGNANYWTTNNISVTAGVTYDAMTDSPTLTSATVANYPTLNPLGGQGGTWSNGNLQYTGPTAWKNTLSTIMLPSTGKFYAEATLLGTGFANNDSYATFGVGTTLGTVPSSNNCSIGDGGDLNNFGTYTTGSGKLSTGDIVSLSIDRDANTFNYRVNNTTRFSGTIGTTAGVDLFFNYWSYSGSYGQMAVNFGQRPFSYTPPTGFVRLNTYNLPDSTIKKGNTVMDATLWTGNGTSQSIVNAGAFKPDFVWVKSRSNTFNNNLFNSTSGVNKFLVSDTTAAEASVTGTLTAFNSNGFSVGSDIGLNFLSGTYVGWQWQAGQGSTSSNTSGSITSTVSVNATAGFSVVTYTGTGANATVGHGLGVAPKMMIVKVRSTTNDWPVYHAGFATPATSTIFLNLTNAVNASSTTWNSTAPTSSVFSIGTTGIINASSATYVAYCWAEIAGFSKFGSYTGNGSADGTFVYTGFRPKYVLLKSSSNASTEWLVWDSSRNQYNSTNSFLYPNLSAEEYTGSAANLDFLSNGFKLRNTNAGTASSNQSGYTYIFAAWAENPFKNANAR